MAFLVTLFSSIIRIVGIDFSVVGFVMNGKRFECKIKNEIAHFLMAKELKFYGEFV
jgi:hypothetical protein